MGQGEPSPISSFFLCPGIRVVGRFIQTKGKPCPINFFVIKGEGLFSAKISIFLMSDRFVGCPAILILCPGIRVVGRFIKNTGEPLPNVFFFFLMLFNMPKLFNPSSFVVSLVQTGLLAVIPYKIVLVVGRFI